MAERVRVGVIGAGNIATLRHLPAFRRCQDEGTVELVGVADPVGGVAQAAAARFGVPHAMEDYRELLALPLDAVSICTPNVYHEPIALAAIDAGMHVLCEKPLAMDHAGARRMYERAEAAGVKTAVNFRYRFIPAAWFARDLIAGGELGEIYHVYANYFNGSLADPATPMAWRQARSESGTGALGDLTSHIIDLCRYWVGEIAAVQGHLRTFTTERRVPGGGMGQVDVDDAATCLFRFANGAEAVVNSSRNAPGRNNYQRIEVYGTKGSLVYEIEKADVGGDRLQLCLGAGQARYNAYATVPVPPIYLAGNPERAMTDFVAAIRDDTPMSPDFADGMHCQEVLDAVEVSARNGAWVNLPL